MSGKNRIYRVAAVAVVAVFAVLAVFYAINMFSMPAEVTNTQDHTMSKTIVPADTPVPSTTPAPTPVSGCQIQVLDLSSAGANAPFSEPEVITATDGSLTTTLTVTYADNKIGDCPVHLRSYNGNLVGPTLRARPGDTLRIKLVNDLPMEHELHEMNTLGAFNHTNLHTHGLHVSPVGNSDNVLLDIAPQTSFDYEIKIPLNQVPGTYWYHAHMHGSTATQVSSGMAGALIIMGDQIPDNVDSLDVVKNATEKIFVFQQIIYDEFGQIEPDRGPLQTFPTYNVAHPDNQISYFGPCNWEPMKREHVINGQLFPQLALTTGEIQRWRFIDAGIRETIGVELIGPYNPGVTPDLNNIDPNKIVKLNEIAVDGIALDHVNAWDQVELEPGYRSDVLVKLLKAGTYFLVDTAVPQTTVTLDPNKPNDPGAYVTNKNVSFSLTCPPTPGQPPTPETPGFLASIVVTGTDILPSTTDEIAALSDQMAKLPVPEILKPIVAITTDTTVTTPANEEFYVALETIDAFQKVDFTLAGHPPVLATAAPASPTSTPLSSPFEFMAADHPFDPQNIRRLKLNNTDEWVLNTQQDSAYYGHPFHIHINSFQTARLGPDGKTYELVWRDTIFVPMGIPIYIFTRYTDYIGAYVYHCHILDHEDQGMMEVVEVVNP